MGREIKFRVWSEEDGEYRTGCRLKELFNSKTGIPAIVYNDEGDGFDIEQYTGLKDKNEKEIYEGDIVEFDFSRYDKLILKRAVVMDDTGVRVNTIGTEFVLIRHLRDVKVVSNIHKNPEFVGAKEWLRQF